MAERPMLPIPIAAARRIADGFGYDQVIIIARRVGDATDPHGEHVTTYGVNKEHCGIAARVGNFLKHKVMGWPEHLPSDRGQFQGRVATWMSKCFPPSLYSSMTERGDRFLEEALELLQSHGYDRDRVAKLVDYVYGRPEGDPAQEVGGVMVTLAAYCAVAALDMREAGEAELSRITAPEVMARIRKKQEAKRSIHFDSPLPGAGCDG